ncbi:hypothetical protein NDU88_006196 [Pleurodeles waltl]|uniref:Uncharacterized protein n=1 Tax=Pleurodeles waltl TaxID=8319 RepID=A0AAV7RPG0_PLEWA|nr:hypothetical protein NDU88_006196 [Pleurodeles waltl]
MIGLLSRPLLCATLSAGARGPLPIPVEHYGRTGDLKEHSAAPLSQEVTAGPGVASWRTLLNRMFTDQRRSGVASSVLPAGGFHATPGKVRYGMQHHTTAEQLVGYEMAPKHTMEQHSTIRHIVQPKWWATMDVTGEVGSQAIDETLLDYDEESL